MQDLRCVLWESTLTSTLSISIVIAPFVYSTGLYDVQDPAPFKFPENDTVIKTARQLSRLASRQSSRASKAMGLELSKEHWSPSNTTQLAMAQNLSKDTSEQLKSYLQKQSRDRCTRSASLSGPMASGHRPMSGRPRSRSATTGSAACSPFPPAPIKVSVSQERIRDGGKKSGSSQQQVRTKLQYTSHWGSP